MENIWTVLCDDVILDHRTKRPSLINCISEGTASQLPVSMPGLHVVSSWLVVKPGDYIFSLEMTHPCGEIVCLKDNVTVKLSVGFAILDFDIESIEAKEYGNHEIRIKCALKKQKCAGHKVLFMLTQKTPEPSSSTSPVKKTKIKEEKTKK